MRVRVREFADKRKKTFSKISQKLKIAERTLYRWNSGEMMPSPANLDKLAACLRCKKSELIEF